jgi:hypothetical protein
MDEPFLMPRKQRPVSRLAVCGVVGICFAAALCCAQLVALRAVIGRMEALELALAASRAEPDLAPEPAQAAPMVLAAGSVGHLDRLPHKFLLDGLTPSADQAFRGDCWLFAVTGACLALKCPQRPRLKPSHLARTFCRALLAPCV